MNLQEYTPMAEPHSIDTAAYELAGHLVLVVEDDYFIAEEICTVLRKRGASVIGPAADVEQGRLLMTGRQLDCAVLDVNLHGEHVFQLAGELQARGVRSIFATGYDVGFLPPAFRDSIYLQKPIDIAGLVRAVKESSRSHRARQN
jgi:DNA-binding response OmpR family regulator